MYNKLMEVNEVEDKKYLTTKELAKIFSVTTRTVVNWREAGMPYKKLGRSVRFDLDEVLAWSEKRNGGKK